MASALLLSFLMNFLIWNSQGAASKRFFRATMSIIKAHKPVCFRILEPKMSSTGANEVCFELGFDFWVHVEAVGMSGGIWVFWRNCLNISIIRTHPQFILLSVSDNRGKN